VRAVSTTRLGGVSVGPYASFNLATHVADDPAAVCENRARLRTLLELPGEPCWLSRCTACRSRRRQPAPPAPRRTPVIPNMPAWCARCWPPIACRCCCVIARALASLRRMPAGRGWPPECSKPRSPRWPRRPRHAGLAGSGHRAGGLRGGRRSARDLHGPRFGCGRLFSCHAFPVTGGADLYQLARSGSPRAACMPSMAAAYAPIPIMSAFFPTAAMASPGAWRH